MWYKCLTSSIAIIDTTNKILCVQNEVERNITILQEKDEEISEVVGKMEGKEDVNIDDVVVPAAPLYRQ